MKIKIDARYCCNDEIWRQRAPGRDRPVHRGRVTHSHARVQHRMRQRCDSSILQYSASQSVVPGLAVPASPGHLVEMQILRFCPRPAESEVLGVEPGNLF